MFNFENLFFLMQSSWGRTRVTGFPASSFCQNTEARVILTTYMMLIRIKRTVHFERLISSTACHHSIAQKMPALQGPLGPFSEDGLCSFMAYLKRLFLLCFRREDIPGMPSFRIAEDWDRSCEHACEWTKFYKFTSYSSKETLSLQCQIRFASQWIQLTCYTFYSWNSWRFSYICLSWGIWG